MPSTVIYGGTFNPIHRGHIDICIRAREAVKADRVLLVPAALPPHKPPEDLAEDEDRLAMCRLAASPYDFIMVDDCEIRKGGKSYTVDTLRALCQLYPGEDFWLLMGTDMFLTFEQWKDWQSIGEMAMLLVASRDENDLESLEKQQLLLKEKGISSVLLQNPAMPISSTQVREELKTSRATDKLCPQVLEYILDHALYCGNTDNLEFLRSYIRPLMTDYRYRHSLGVEKQAVHLAQRWNCNLHKAAVAGILHDVCKDMPREPLLQTILDSGIINGIDFKASPQLIHSYAGALYLQTHLGQTDRDVVEAVRYHTTARGGMSLLEKIIYLADLTSEDREYEDVVLMRQLCETDLDAAMAHALRFTVEDLTKRNRPISPNTREACREYCGITDYNNGGNE